MSRQSITFTPPNDEWIKAQVTSHEYSTKSDVVNDLIRRARKEQEELELLRAKLIRSEESGYSNRTPE
ncbi:MAG: type II toxin-antitoxin system ParD family antitoxin, partial [Gammaproteobacteria bacterium]|nr:type II toxin-antitoxin system ParD family antitoxin [Gammaproteobacteria bacterium]